MRRLIVFVLSLAALCGSFVAAVGTIQQRDTHLRGYVDPAQNANLPYHVPRRGVNASLEQYTPPELEAQLDLMQSADMTWVQQIFPWEALQPEPDEYNWETWDSIVTAVAARDDLKLIAVLYTAPTWARDERTVDHPFAPPQDPNEFAQFATQFAERYGTSINHYQIWDEPNLRDAWGGLDPRATEYAALLQASYEAIHNADPDATVITAALAPTTETGPHNIAEHLFLSDLYALGAANYMDAVGAKPYGFDSSPQDRTVDPSVLSFSRIVLIREVMVAAGDSKKAVWASNWGWNSLPNDWGGNPSIWGQVDQSTQVNYTLSALERINREFPWIAGMTLHHWQPIAEKDDPMWGFALISQEDTQSALLNALQELPAAQSAQNGLYPPDTHHATYSGVWTFSDLGADVGWLSDSQLEFNFFGSDLALLVRQGDFIAYLYPTIDNAPVNSLPTDADGNPYLILTSPSLQPELSLELIAQNLPEGQHTLRAVADRGWDQWVLAGYAVSSGDLAAPFNRQITIAWWIVAVAAVATVVSAWQLPWRAINKPLVGLWQRLGMLSQFSLGLIASLLLLVGMFLTWGGGTPTLLKRDIIALPLSLATAGLIYIEPGLLLTILAVIVLFFVTYHRIDIGLMLTILWVPFFLFPVQLYLYAFPLAEILILLTFGAWFLNQLVAWAQRYKADNIHPPLHIKLTATDIGVIAYMATGCVALFWSDLLDPALTELRVMFIEPVLFYIVFRTSVKSHHQAVLMVDVLLVAALVASLIGLWMYATGENVITAEGDARRLAGVYGSPNNVALFLGRVIPFALAYVLLYRKRRWFGSIVLVLTLLTFAFTQSVGGLFIGLPVAVAVVLLLSYGRSAIVPLGTLGVVAVGAFAFLSRFPRFGGVLDFSSGTNFRRIRVWQSGIQAIQDYPLTGLGLDQFLYAFRSHYILPDAWQEPDLSHPHNFLLDFWIRLGLLGVVVFVWLQIAFWQNIRHVLAQNHPGDVRVLTIGCAGAMANLLAHGLVDNSVFVNDLAIIFVFLLALSQYLQDTSQA